MLGSHSQVGVSVVVMKKSKNGVPCAVSREMAKRIATPKVHLDGSTRVHYEKFQHIVCMNSEFLSFIHNDSISNYQSLPRGVLDLMLYACWAWVPSMSCEAPYVGAAEQPMRGTGTGSKMKG